MNKRFRSKHSLARIVSWLLIASPVLAGQALAQSAESSSSGEISEIVVTAQKRSERLQEIPAAATVVTSTDLVNASVQTVQDVATLTPNLVIIDQLRPGIQTVSFRGFTTVQGGQSPFAIVVDGVPEPGQEFLKQQLVDVQQIEVLRGPQGTLYGAGAIAGAINIVTRPPGDSLEVDTKLTYAEGNDKTATMTLGGPLGEAGLKGRVSAFWRNSDGLIRNAANPRDVDFSNERSFASELLATPTDRLDVSLRGRYTRGTNGALWLVLVTNDQFDNFSKGPAEDQAGIDQRELTTVSLKADYRFDPFTFTSITAYNNAKQYLTADGDFTAAPLFSQTWLNNTNAWSQEFRLTSRDDSPVVWNVGVYGQDYQVHDDTTFFSVNPASPFSVENDTRFKTESYAAFGQATYEFVPRWKATLGARYDRVKASFLDPLTGDHGDHTFSETQPKATLSFRAAPTVLSYFTYSKGFRTGGFNPNTPLTIRLYNDETANNYELGIKTNTPDSRLLFNAAVFHTDFNDQQFFFSQATSVGIFRAIINIPETRVNGAEAEAQARVTERLRLLLSLGYNDTNISRFVNPQYNDKRVPQVYGFTGTLSAEYTQPLTSGYSVTVRTDYNRRGPVYWDLANVLRTPSKNFLNARVALQGSNGRWTLAAVGRNITDERTPAAVGANAFGPGLTLRSANEPRQVGAEVEVRF